MAIGLVGCGEKTPPKGFVSDGDVKKIVRDSVDQATKEILSTVSDSLEKNRRDIAQQLDKAIEADAALAERNALAHKYEAAKALTDEAKRRYEEDIKLAATLSPEEHMVLLTITRKRKSGEALVTSEIKFASRFHEFEEYVKQESERLIKAVGTASAFSPPKEK